MASGARAANVRTVLATAAVTNKIQMTHLDGDSCTVVVDDQTKLNGSFADLGIQEFQMSAFRSLLAGFCPEPDVKAAVNNQAQFPLAATTPIPIVVGALEALLDNSANFAGKCLTN